jgi:hypothetical protein
VGQDTSRNRPIELVVSSGGTGCTDHAEAAVAGPGVAAPAPFVAVTHRAAARLAVSSTAAARGPITEWRTT